jgi:hypothetical protein
MWQSCPWLSAAAAEAHVAEECGWRHIPRGHRLVDAEDPPAADRRPSDGPAPTVAAITPIVKAARSAARQVRNPPRRVAALCGVRLMPYPLPFSVSVLRC